MHIKIMMSIFLMVTTVSAMETGLPTAAVNILHGAIAAGDLKKVEMLLASESTVLKEYMAHRERILDTAQTIAKTFGIQKDFKKPTPKDRILFGVALIATGLVKGGIDIGLYTHAQNDIFKTSEFGVSIVTDVGLVTGGGYQLFCGIKKRDPKITIDKLKNAQNIVDLLDTKLKIADK